MSTFEFQEILPIGKDETTYRLLSKEGVSTFQAEGRTFLRVDPKTLTLLTREAMRDIAHLLRPAHLAQLAKIFEDPEASPNDRTRATPEDVVAGQYCRSPGRDSQRMELCATVWD